MDKRILRCLEVILILTLFLSGCIGGGGGNGGGGTSTYTVTYIGNENTGGTPPNSSQHTVGQSVAVPGNTGNLTKTGYVFTGWSTGKDGSGITYTQGQTFTMGAANVTLYAKWTTNPTYTVTYNGNGNDGGSVPDSTTCYEAGQIVTVLGPSDLVKGGYAFAGWRKDGTGTPYLPGDTFEMGTANVTLSAQWTPSELIFNSGFEPNTNITPQYSGDTRDMVYITGIDNSFGSPNNWLTNLGYSKFGTFSIQYNKPGEFSERNAQIIDDPTTGNGNKILRFYVGSVPDNYDRGRVQAIVHNNSVNLTEIYYKFRMYLHQDFNELKTYGWTFDWLTLAEFWNQNNWSGLPYPFRVSLNINKTTSAAANNLYFTVYGQIAGGSDSWWDSKEWSETNLTDPVPIGQWLTCEIWYKQGNTGTGRFYYAITPEGGPKQVIFDITNYTHHPGNPAPDGLRYFHPLKLYTSKQVANYVRDRGQGKALRIYWDDLEFRTTRP